MKIDPHTYAESFITEDPFKTYARARGVEIGAHDVTPGVGAYLKHLAFTLSAQAVVEIGTGSGVGSLWLLDGMLASGTLTSIDDEMEHTQIAKLAFADAEISATRYRLITNSVLDVISKLTPFHWPKPALKNSTIRSAPPGTLRQQLPDRGLVK